tara:strand:- start:12 stop:161 length:150 start_codon:yes stop_codon:yes gene_type:complete
MEIKSAKYIAEGGKNSTIKLVLNIMPKDIEFMLVPMTLLTDTTKQSKNG